MRHIFEAPKDHQYAIGIVLGRNDEGIVSLQLAPVKGCLNPVLAIGMALGVIHGELQKCESPQGQEVEGMQKFVKILKQLVDDDGVARTLSSVLGYGFEIACNCCEGKN